MEMMKRVLIIVLASLLISFTASGVLAQQSADPSITATRVIGEVAEVDPSGQRMVIRTDAGSIITVLLDANTQYLRVPPGETSLEKAVKITLADIGPGDKVYARGRVSQDGKTIPAQKLVIMSKADIQKKQERERAEWRRRGISGIIAALNPQTKQITIEARTREGKKPVIIETSDKVIFRRYAPDSVKFSDARPSSFAELKVGDQLRALGDRSTDGSHFVAEQIVSGSFRTVGGTVTAVNPETNEIKIAMLGSKQQLTVVVSKDSMLRRIPPQVAAFIAMRSMGMGPGNQPPQGSPARAQMQRRQTEFGQNGSAGTRPMESGDLQDMIERLPTLTLAEIKPGDVIAVSSTVGVDPSRLTAITLVTGVDAILSAIERAGSQRVLNLSTGLPSGVLDFGIGQP
jgi:hypothetical protein